MAEGGLDRGEVGRVGGLGKAMGWEEGRLRVVKEFGVLGRGG